MFVALVTTIEIACIDPHQTGFVRKDSDHLQLIKFWPSCAIAGVCSGTKFFWLRLTTARSVCVSSEHFFIGPAAAGSAGPVPTPMA